MTDDIVARLRGTIPSSYDARDAADAIERLRAELAAANKRMSKLDFERTAAELERDALRELLREARNFMPFYTEELRARIDAALNQGDRDE